MNRKLKIEELNRLSVQDFRNSEKFPVVLVLENIRSLNNIGSAFRSADAMGIESIYLAGYTAKPPHRDINKTAIGATESVDWQYFDNMDAIFSDLNEKGYSCFAIEQTDRSIPLNKFNWKPFDKIAIILGNELTGVEQHSIDKCVESIEIPQFGTKHSFNISVCAGIVLWDIVSKRFIG